MESSKQGDYLSQYKLISSKIRKRFLRKPNIAEASEDFSKLARSLSDSESWAQAGLCCLAVARCEQSLFNPITEIASMIEAGRKFLKAEQVNHQLQCPNYDEHLISAISCYELSINLYKEQAKYALAASLGIELSQALCELGKYSEALMYLQDASTLLQNSVLDYAQCLSLIASCKIELGDIDGALTVFFKISSLLTEHDPEYTSGAHREILTRCEICSIILLLTIQPLPSLMKSDHAKLLEKYSANDQAVPIVPYEDEEMLVLLQSLVIACQTRDLDSLSFLSTHLSQKLSGQPLRLLHILITEMNRS